MKKTKKINGCSNFKPMHDYVSHYRNSPSQNCNECIYFSSRNCKLDISDSIEMDLDFL